LPREKPPSDLDTPLATPAKRYGLFWVSTARPWPDLVSGGMRWRRFGDVWSWLLTATRASSRYHLPRCRIWLNQPRSSTEI